MMKWWPFLPKRSILPQHHNVTLFWPLFNAATLEQGDIVTTLHNCLDSELMKTNPGCPWNVLFDTRRSVTTLKPPKTATPSPDSRHGQQTTSCGSNWQLILWVLWNRECGLCSVYGSVAPHECSTRLEGGGLWSRVIVIIIPVLLMPLIPPKMQVLESAIPTLCTSLIPRKWDLATFQLAPLALLNMTLCSPSHCWITNRNIHMNAKT